MKKFSNSAAIYFKKLVNGESFEDINRFINQEESDKQPIFHLSDQDVADNIDYELEDFNKASALFLKMKPLESVKYAINPWGYGQTNLDNITLVGQVRTSLVFVDSNNVYTVSKGKFNKQELTHLDDVRSTSWKPAYTAEEKANQIEYNANYGY